MAEGSKFSKSRSTRISKKKDGIYKLRQSKFNLDYTKNITYSLKTPSRRRQRLPKSNDNSPFDFNESDNEAGTIDISTIIETPTPKKRRITPVSKRSVQTSQPNSLTPNRQKGAEETTPRYTSKPLSPPPDDGTSRTRRGTSRTKQGTSSRHLIHELTNQDSTPSEIPAPPLNLSLWQPENGVERDQSELNELDICLSVYSDILQDALTSSSQPIKSCLETHQALIMSSSCQHICQLIQYNILMKAIKEKREEHGVLISSIKVLLNDISQTSAEYSAVKCHTSKKKQKELTDQLAAILDES